MVYCPTTYQRNVKVRSVIIRGLHLMPVFSSQPPQKPKKTTDENQKKSNSKLKAETSFLERY
jgi:hypothetical protein